MGGDDGVRHGRLGAVPRRRFPHGRLDPLALVGGAGFGGALQHPGLLAVAALVSALVPSAHEIRNMRPMPWPAIAVGAAVLAGFCVLEVGNGPPLNFIYFQF